MLFLALGIFGFVLSTEDNSTFGKSLSAIFAVVGLASILNIPFYIRIMKTGGDVALEVSKEGVSISPVMNEPMVSFPWRYISGVAIATTGYTTNTRYDLEKIVGISRQAYAREKGIFYTKEARQSNLVIMFLLPGSDWEKNVKSIWRTNYVGITPKGQSFLCMQYPNCSQVRIVQPFRKFSNDAIDVKYWHKIHFNYKTNDEEYIP